MTAEEAQRTLTLTDGYLPTVRYVRSDGRIDVRRIAAVVVDIDGVVTDTARIHAEAWKVVFDAFLRARSLRRGERVAPFDLRYDYATHMAGRPRSDGIRSFLDSRGVLVPEVEGDEREPRTVRRLGDLKDRHLSAELGRNRVVAYPSTVAFLRDLREHQTRVAAVSSSPYGAAVLRAAGIAEIFDVVVTGFDTERPLPMPALLRLAVSRLDLPAATTAVVSTSPACLESASREGFGFVVGVSRSHLDVAALHQRGADLVVPSLADVPVVRRTSTTGRGGVA